MEPRIGILILAAGASTRMGRPKQLLPWRGSTLLQDTIERTRGLKYPVAVVLGANSEEILEQTDFGSAVPLINNAWEEGMGTSIAFGLQSFMEMEEGLDAVLIILGDQPLIDKEFLQRMIDTYISGNAPIIATKYRHTLGVPALFNEKYFGELLNLKGSHGARSLLENSKTDVVAIEGKEKVFDIDDPDDYARLLREFTP